jgi:prolyl-tRNA editing enzyme YbaK/EbsC (Cys-tRNA(Pro) deacylase)
MSIENARAHLDKWGRGKDIIQFDQSTATVLEAAAALGTIPARIAKSISLYWEDGAMIVVTAGDTKLDNRKYKDRFQKKARMLSADDAVRLTGYAPGGICPFGLPPGVTVYLDESLKRFETVFPACGSAHSAIELTLPELEVYAGPAAGQPAAWADLCSPIPSPTAA